MINNIITEIQQRLGTGPLQKIDPNTQDIKPAEASTSLLAQAAIPAMLTGLYKYGHSDEGAKQILRGNISTSWVKTLFGDTADVVVTQVADYSGVTTAEAEDAMEKSAHVAINITREQLKGNDNKDQLKKFLTSQRNVILKHLPAQLDIGKLLNDETLDDKTNKMEGPISNLMHSIEKGFSKGG